jgi:hypothetical protein
MQGWLGGFWGMRNEPYPHEGRGSTWTWMSWFVAFDMLVSFVVCFCLLLCSCSSWFKQCDSHLLEMKWLHDGLM